MQDLTPAQAALRDAARNYHRQPTRGKVAVVPTKPLSNQHDLSLAYSPGVAYPCLDIQANPTLAAEYTARGNLVGVVTNGTAVLGLGDIGPLAGKPVMEGKGCLFKKFAGIDVFDIELAERDPDKLVDIIAALEPTLGGVNLEDIKAPECFYIERKLRERMNIPVFHDDQHGTAIIAGAALLNGLELVDKRIEDAKVAVSGAGAAALACLDVLVGLGAKPQNIFVCDSKGVIYEGRPGGFDESKARYAQKTEARTLADVVRGADVFLGCSTAGVLSADMVKSMADKPVILALANPNPEIDPAEARLARPDCIIATGRSDYPNQVNNVLCFPYIFRGALDCGATRITEEMKLACVREIAALAKAESSAEVAAAYAGKELNFAPAVAEAAARSGVATRPITDIAAYRASLERYIYQSGMLMRPVISAAQAVPAAQKRVVYAEGEDERVLRAVQSVVDDGLATPLLVGRQSVIERRIARAGLRLKVGRDVQVCDPETDSRYETWWKEFHRLMARNGVTQEAARAAVRRSTTVLAALMVRMNDADAMICGTLGRFDVHFQHVSDIIGKEPHAPCMAALNALIAGGRTLFIADTYINSDPGPELLASIARLAVQEVRNFAVLSHSNFGSSTRPSALKMRAARDLFRQQMPDVECDGEMHGDTALSPELRARSVPDSTLSGEANLLICPSLDAANILFNVLKTTDGNGVTIGPILLGAAAPVHVLTPSATVRRLINMTALAVAEAQSRRAAH